MSRWVYIADTHIGAGEQGFCQAPRFHHLIPRIFRELKRWISEQGNIDGILHGGDIVDDGRRDLIGQAAELLAGFDLPVYCTLGNHDLSRPESLRSWLDLAPQLFAGEGPDYKISLPGMELAVLSTQWGGEVYYWKESQDAGFLPRQREMLQDAFLPDAPGPRVLLTHSPACEIGAERTGLEHAIHPVGGFRRELAEMVQEYRFSMILGAHNHVNMHSVLSSASSLTVSALYEAPFSFRLIEMEGSSVLVETVDLWERVMPDLPRPVIPRYVLGRKTDRQLVLS